MEFYNELNSLKSIIDREIKKKIYDKYCFQKRIFDAIEYSIFTGGKRLRPIMAIKSCEMFKDDIQGVLPYSVAIEMIHTYSLIHDEIGRASCRERV